MNEYLYKFKHSLPWLARYPLVRASAFLRGRADEKTRVIITIADHFEPAWSAGGHLGIDVQRRRLDAYYKTARATGEAVRDSDGTKFRHTNFYPAEQYDAGLLDVLAEMQREGLGEVEIHLHHGLEKPDTAENLRKVLIEFRDILAERHKCLSRLDGAGEPRYAFVHGNLALANSYGGKFCGVDDEMQILSETGCYADMTLPSAPLETQVPVLNKIYECARPLTERAPHRKGKDLTAGKMPQFPIIFTGPLVFNWTRRIRGLPVPRLDDGALAANQPLDEARFRRWLSAGISVAGRPEWIFIKLYCHGFFDHDQEFSIGEQARRFFSETVERGEKTGEYSVHFASAREAVNMVFAALDGRKGSPNDFRDYRLRPVMSPEFQIDEREGENQRAQICI
jgi:hypothetical protein